MKKYLCLFLLSMLAACADDPLVVQQPQPVVLLQGICQVDQAATPDPFIDCVEKFSPTAGTTFGQDKYPQIIFNAPEGAGESQGSLDVLSLGCGGSITVFFDDPAIANGTGVDFSVFENAFKAGSVSFVEPAQVSVSEDGQTWFDFPCDYLNVAATGCAGVSPVYANSQNGVSPLDPAVSGGDSFDLDGTGMSTVRYVKLEDKTKEYYAAQNLSSTIYCGLTGGFDLDAIAAINVGP